MSWLRSSPLRQSLTRSNSGNSNTGSFVGSSNFFNSSSGGSSQPAATTAGSTNVLRQRPIDTATDCDPRACYDSFCKHWQQAHDIIQRSELPHKPPTHDNVLGVVSHLDYMVTLLLVELHYCNKISLPASEHEANGQPPAPCLEYMLSENLLDKLYEWGCSTGRYSNAVRLEQLKLYELLVSHSRHQLLCHEPFLRPLLKLLASSQGEIFPPDLEKRLVILLNQLCVVLMQNVHLLDLFFFSAAQEQHKQQESNGKAEQSKAPLTSSTNFIIFSLLIPYVHREGSLGHQARDALLLCMALSQKNSNIGTYIAQYSSMCPLLVTGLGGLYSRLPNSIEITSIDWHRITPDDVTEISELTLFMNALEFCNAVVQVAHEMIKQQLLDFMYQGFIVPVLGPAILQTPLNGKHLQTNVESQISAMSYFDLILRSVTEPGLLRAFVRFLLDAEKFDGVRIVDVLVERISSTDANLCMVTMALFDTLLGLNCEDLMLELLLKYLLPGKHVPISHRHKINKIDPYTNSTAFFLDLTPDVMKRARDLTKHKHLGDTVANGSGTQAHAMTQPSPTSTMSKTIGANWNYYGLHSGDSLYANLQAYLLEAHFRIAQCRSACTKWANTYKYQKWPPRNIRGNAQAMEMVKQFFAEFNASPVTSTTQHHGPSIANNNNNTHSTSTVEESTEKKQLDSLQSLGESSGYESFKWRPADDDAEAPNETNPNSTAISTNSGGLDGLLFDGSSVVNSNCGRCKDWWRVSSLRSDLMLTDLDFSEDLFAQGTVSLGPFLNAIWGKLQTFTSNTLYVNFHLTGLITHLAWYPLPLVHSILLRPDIVITSDTPSFHQVLRILKQQIDAELPVVEDSLEIIDVARSYLIDREFRLINSRKASENSPIHAALKGVGGVGAQRLPPTSTYANISAASPVQVMPSSSYDPFKRNDNKRKSISKSITSMFSRKVNGTSQPNQASTQQHSSTISNASGQFTGSSAGSTASLGNTRETSLTKLPTSSTTTDQMGSLPEQSPADYHPTHPLAANTHTTVGHASSSSSTGHRDSGATYSASSGVATSSLGVAGSTTTLSSTLSAASTLLGSVSAGVLGGGAGGNSEPVSLESLSSMGAIASTSGTERTRDLALCAVLLDEWLKELAAIAQEQSIVLVSLQNL